MKKKKIPLLCFKMVNQAYVYKVFSYYSRNLMLLFVMKEKKETGIMLKLTMK